MDVSASTGNLIYAWGEGRVVAERYNPGGYNRYIQVYFPATDQSLTLGHLLEGSQMGVGTTFSRGDVWAKIGTDEDGLGTSHVHYRAGWGNYGRAAISPCEDIDPFIVWNDLGLPSG